MPKTGSVGCVQTAKLIESGSLKLLLWEGYWGCEGFPRCSAQEQFAIEYAVAYQPLQFSVIGMRSCWLHMVEADPVCLDSASQLWQLWRPCSAACCPHGRPQHGVKLSVM